MSSAIGHTNELYQTILERPARGRDSSPSSDRPFIHPLWQKGTDVTPIYDHGGPIQAACHFRTRLRVRSRTICGTGPTQQHFRVLHSLQSGSYTSTYIRTPSHFPVHFIPWRLLCLTNMPINEFPVHQCTYPLSVHELSTAVTHTSVLETLIQVPSVSFTTATMRSLIYPATQSRRVEGIKRHPSCEKSHTNVNPARCLSSASALGPPHATSPSSKRLQPRICQYTRGAPRLHCVIPINIWRSLTDVSLTKWYFAAPPHWRSGLHRSVIARNRYRRNNYGCGVVGWMMLIFKGCCSCCCCSSDQRDDKKEEEHEGEEMWSCGVWDSVDEGAKHTVRRLLSSSSSLSWHCVFFICRSTKKRYR